MPESDVYTPMEVQVVDDAGKDFYADAATENGLAAADLRAKLMDLVKRRNLPYGIVVRRLKALRTPIQIYEKFPDGHEEAIRGMQFVGLNAAAFKDIVAASKDQHMPTVEFRPHVTFPTFSMGGEGYIPLSLAVPSLLFEDSTIRKVRGETPNPPVAKHPSFDKQRKPRLVSISHLKAKAASHPRVDFHCGSEQTVSSR